jgi:4-alpha-glucanotransferase
VSEDELVKRLATRAGFAVDWVDQSGKEQTVSAETLRALLKAMGLPSGGQRETEDSLAKLDEIDARPAKLTTATVGQSFAVDAKPGATAKLVREDGESFDLTLGDAGGGKASMRPILESGYHTLHAGGAEIALAIAPTRGRSIVDAAGGRRMWGLAAQVYGLTRKGDGGIGDMGGVAALADALGRAGADALALSPVHAGFSADPDHFGPYSPSSRLFLNPLNADPEFLFGEDRVEEAARVSQTASARRGRESEPLIDWPEAARAKLATFRALFESFRSVELAEGSAGHLATDFGAFRAQGGSLLEEHARFEALHEARFGKDLGQWDWRSWPEELRNPQSDAVAAFATDHAGAVDFHLFLQWIADRSFAAAQAAAKSAGMSIGLISDLAVGMDAGGSHAWSRQSDVLVGLSVGSPPDMFNPNGQAWGLAAFSPIALKTTGFAPYLATLRACMRNAGGVRIDHAMGLARLWMVPEGAKATEGAYLSFPLDDMLRLTALESERNNAVVVGEDLGTVPEGFREKIGAAGIAGMRVLQFERDDQGRFFAPGRYDADALAMTTTHDLPTMAGWWSGADIELRASIPGDQFGETQDNERDERAKDRPALWSALREAGVAEGETPDPDAPDTVVDGSVAFLAKTPSRLVLLPLEDALGQIEQPNLPGTLDEHPNWRRRLNKPAPELLAEPGPSARLAALNRRRAG